MNDVATVTTHTLGNNIAELRHQKKLTQQQLAGTCGVSRPRISEIESGQFNPSVETVEGIAKALGVSVSRLFRGC